MRSGSTPILLGDAAGGKRPYLFGHYDPPRCRRASNSGVPFFFFSHYYFFWPFRRCREPEIQSRSTSFCWTADHNIVVIFTVIVYCGHIFTRFARGVLKRREHQRWNTMYINCFPAVTITKVFGKSAAIYFNSGPRFLCRFRTKIPVPYSYILYYRLYFIWPKICPNGVPTSRSLRLVYNKTCNKDIGSRFICYLVESHLSILDFWFYSFILTKKTRSALSIIYIIIYNICVFIMYNIYICTCNLQNSFIFVRCLK